MKIIERFIPFVRLTEMLVVSSFCVLSNSNVIVDNEGVTRALKAEVAQPAPRVRPEAAEIANQHKGFIKNLIVDVSNKPKQG